MERSFLTPQVAWVYLVFGFTIEVANAHTTTPSFLQLSWQLGAVLPKHAVPLVPLASNGCQEGNLSESSDPICLQREYHNVTAPRNLRSIEIPWFAVCFCSTNKSCYLHETCWLIFVVYSLQLWLPTRLLLTDSYSTRKYTECQEPFPPLVPLTHGATLQLRTQERRWSAKQPPRPTVSPPESGRSWTYRGSIRESREG